MNPLQLDLSESALAELSAAGEYVRFSQGDAAAERFSERVSEAFGAATTRLAREISQNITGKPFDPVDPVASARWAQPVYRMRVETADKRARYSSARLWYVLLAP